MNIFKRKKTQQEHVLESHGICPVCEEEVLFQSDKEWLRDWFLCTNCGSVPRERALMYSINKLYPKYENMIIHESSPSNRGVSLKMNANCQNYTSSYFYPDVALGECHPKFDIQCQNLESLTFDDESFDLFITQDVLEHVFDPAKAFSEIARVLKPGGAHIFTVPLINEGHKKSECWASLNEKKEIVYHHEPEYHGSPIDDNGSLVTMHWGYDITDFIFKKSGIPTTIIMIDDLRYGIRAEYIEVLVSCKY